MTKIGITIPAIVDQECADAVVKGIASNIVEKNYDFEFVIFLNIDNYCRKGCSGTPQSISEKYKELENGKNCIVKVFHHSPALGLTRSSKFLFERFMEEGCEFLLFLDDDCVIINPIPFLEFIHLAKNGDTIHLAFAYDDRSVESPFITNNVYFDGENTRVFYNNRVFCTENGTIFCRGMVKRILKQCNFNPMHNPEDEIGKTKAYMDSPVYTVARKINGNATVVPGVRFWPLPKENHFIVDAIRYYRKVGWNK